MLENNNSEKLFANVKKNFRAFFIFANFPRKLIGKI